MFRSIAIFEFRYQLRNPVFWVALIVFFLLAFGATSIDQIQIGASGNVHRNGPYAIAQIQLVFSLFYMFVSTAFVANVVIRDDETGFGPIVQTTRMSQRDYLLGRYVGAVLAAAVGLLAIPLGLRLGAAMPWVDPETLGPNAPSFYLFPYALLALPDLFFTSALFFALATVTRSIMATYLGVIAFLIVWTVANIALEHNAAWELASAFGEPFGFGAFDHVTRYWTANERNVLASPLTTVLLSNRIIWIVVGAAALAVAHALFRFEQRPNLLSRRTIRLTNTEQVPIGAERLPDPGFGFATLLVQSLSRTRVELMQVLGSRAYLVLLLLGLFSGIGSLIDLGQIDGTSVLPVTRVVITQLEGSFGIVPLIIAIYYGGEVVWRERDLRVHELMGASPVPDWMFTLPKALGVSLVLISTLLVSVVGGLAVQVFHDYTFFRLDEYLLWYILPLAVDVTLMAVLSIFVQTLSPNKFIGWGLMLLFVIAKITLGQIGLGDHLYNYASRPEVPLSDMNGQGRFWIGAWAFRAYWSAFAVCLLVISHALWRRSAETRLMPRLKRLPRRMMGPAGIMTAIALSVFVGLGTWIFINTHVWNEYRTSLDEDRYRADYEKTLLRFENLPQPSIVDAVVRVDIRPQTPSLVATGMLDLVNRSGRPLDELHVRLASRDSRVAALVIPGATLVRDYPRFQYRIYRFATPLRPGQAARVAFRTVRMERGFRDHGDDTHLVGNGTFLSNSEFVPTIGMDRDGLLEDRATRRRYGLPPELHMPRLEDKAATAFNQLHGDWIRTDITVSTDADQTPIAPGDKVSDLIVNGRRTARFVTTAPILNFYSIQSARYAERHEVHGGVDLAVYFDPAHSRNVDRMLATFAHALDLYTAAFGPYQFHYARIVEFPDYGKFAQAFAGTMPYSEGLGFIADLDDPDKIDYVSYIASHELSHQWWAHQAIGADMQGGTMLTETLAQYSALMVMEHLYGRDQIRRFLKYELDDYLSARGSEAIGELPLDRVEGQGYIHYRKGSLAMYRLRDVLGEGRVDAALRRYLASFRFKPAPFPRSLDLIAEFRRGASPAEQSIITDLFDRITIYDVKTLSAATQKRIDGTYSTTLTVEAHKYYADGKGKESEAPLAENIDYGVFCSIPGRGRFSSSDVLALQRMPVHSGVQMITLITRNKPAFAGSDPYNTLIDRNSDDNIVSVK